MYRCLDCLACNDICPVGIKPADLCLEARYAIHQATRTPPLKPLIFRGIFPHTGVLESGYQARGALRSHRAAQGGECRRRYQAAAGAVAGHGAYATQQAAAARRPPPVPCCVPARGERRAHVAYFLGCVQGVMMAEGCKATVEVLAENGCDVVILPGRQVLWHANGRLWLQMTSARDGPPQHRPVLALNVDAIVTDCATCGSSLERVHSLAGRRSRLRGARRNGSPPKCVTSASFWSRSASATRGQGGRPGHLPRSLPPVPGAGNPRAAPRYAAGGGRGVGGDGRRRYLLRFGRHSAHHPLSHLRGGPSARWTTWPRPERRSLPAAAPAARVQWTVGVEAAAALKAKVRVPASCWLRPTTIRGRGVADAD